MKVHEKSWKIPHRQQAQSQKRFVFIHGSCDSQTKPSFSVLFAARPTSQPYPDLDQSEGLHRLGELALGQIGTMSGCFVVEMNRSGIGFLNSCRCPQKTPQHGRQIARPKFRHTQGLASQLFNRNPLCRLNGPGKSCFGE